MVIVMLLQQTCVRARACCTQQTTLLSDLDVVDVPVGYGGTREEAYPIPNAPGEENVEQVVLKK